MEARKHDYVIVGSGMGGATLARELAAKNKDVLVIERGRKEAKVGTFRDSLRFFDLNSVTQMPKKSREGTIMWRTFMAGGSTVVSCGNGVRALQSELIDRGIALEQEFQELEQDLRVKPIDERLVSEGGWALAEAGKELGYRFEPMPKFIDAEKCDKCGNCVFGCKHGAKWSALKYLEESETMGAEVLFDAAVDEVLIDHGRTTGVKGHVKGQTFTASADNVILSAGGIGTPVILQRSGIEAGKGLFLDLLVNTYASVPQRDLMHEPSMSLVELEFHKDRGFLLSPFANHGRGTRLTEFGLSHTTYSDKSLLGLMVKTVDDRTGQVHPDGSVSKPVTEADHRRLDEGSAVARDILIKAGGDRKSIGISKVQGAHPGGTAAIGEVVDANLETEVSGLFCCDSSVLPEAPGLPPMLTIGALSKYLAKRLVA